MKKFKSLLKYIFLKLPYGRKLWQLSRALFLLREKSFRDLFLVINKDDVCLDLGANKGHTTLIMWLKGAKYI